MILLLLIAFCDSMPRHKCTVTPRSRTTPLLIYARSTPPPAPGPGTDLTTTAHDTPTPIILHPHTDAPRPTCDLRRGHRHRAPVTSSGCHDTYIPRYRLGILPDPAAQLTFSIEWFGPLVAGSNPDLAHSHRRFVAAPKYTGHVSRQQ